MYTNNKVNPEIEYFIAGPNTKSSRAASAETTRRMYSEFSDVLRGIGCFRRTFFLKVKDDAKPDQAPPRCAAYALEESFRK